jgi:hypothetical protein
MFTIQRGNPVSKTITITYSDGTPYDLTGKTIFFTVKNKSDNNSDDSDALIEKDITTHSHADAGESLLELTAAQTDIPLGDYECDFKIYSGSVNINTSKDIFEVVEIVTKRTS